MCINDNQIRSADCYRMKDEIFMQAGRTHLKDFTFLSDHSDGCISMSNEIMRYDELTDRWNLLLLQTKRTLPKDSIFICLQLTECVSMAN